MASQLGAMAVCVATDSANNMHSLRGCAFGSRCLTPVRGKKRPHLLELAAKAGYDPARPPVWQKMRKRGDGPPRALTHPHRQRRQTRNCPQSGVLRTVRPPSRLQAHSDRRPRRRSHASLEVGSPVGGLDRFSRAPECAVRPEALLHVQRALSAPCPCRAAGRIQLIMPCLAASSTSKAANPTPSR